MHWRDLTGIHQIKKALLWLDTSKNIPSQLQEEIKSMIHPQPNVEQCIVLAEKYNDNPAIALLGALTLIFFRSVHFIEESLSYHHARKMGRKATFLQAIAPMNIEHCYNPTVRDFSKTLELYSSYIHMYKKRKQKHKTSIFKQLAMDMKSAIDKKNDVIAKFQCNHTGSTVSHSELTKALKEDNERSAALTAALEDHMDMLDDLFDDDKEEILRKRWKTLSEMCRSLHMMDLEPLPDDKLAMFVTASDALTQIARRMADGNFLRFTREIMAPLYAEVGPIRLGVKTDEEIQKMLRSGDCMRDVIATRVALASWAHITAVNENAPTQMDLPL